MCSEKRPIDCHRYFLVSKKIEQKFGDWLDVEHIIQNESDKIATVSNETLNKQLSEIVSNKSEIKKLDVLNSSIFDQAKIENYFGKRFQQTDSVIIFELSKSCKITKYGYAKNDDEELIII